MNSIVKTYAEQKRLPEIRVGRMSAIRFVFPSVPKTASSVRVTLKTGASGEVTEYAASFVQADDSWVCVIGGGAFPYVDMHITYEVSYTLEGNQYWEGRGNIVTLEAHLTGEPPSPAPMTYWVKSVNGVSADENGNVSLPLPFAKSVNGNTPDKSGNITIDIPTPSQQADIKAVEDIVMANKPVYGGAALGWYNPFHFRNYASYEMPPFMKTAGVVAWGLRTTWDYTSRTWSGSFVGVNANGVVVVGPSVTSSANRVTLALTGDTQAKITTGTRQSFYLDREMAPSADREYATRILALTDKPHLCLGSFAYGEWVSEYCYEFGEEETLGANIKAVTDMVYNSSGTYVERTRVFWFSNDYSTILHDSGEFTITHDTDTILSVKISINGKMVNFVMRRELMTHH